MMGIEPTFNLLTPTYDEFEGNARYVSGLGIQIAKVLGTEIDGFPIINFQKAGVAVSYYHRYSTNTWKLGGARNDYDANLQNVNTGKILCDYYDNEKWIIKEETDENGNSYWTVQSAGWIDWDWTNLNGDFAKLFWESPDKAMAYGLNLYTKAVTFAQVAGGAKRDGRVPYATQLLAYLGLWATDTWYSHRKYNPFWHFAYMVLLSDYAENVYIAGGFKHSGTTKFNGAITNQALSNGELTASYGMDFINTATLEQYNYWLDEDIKTTWDNWDFAWFYENMSAEWTYDRLGISVTKEVTSATGEATTVYKTIDEIKKCLLFHVEPNWAPTKGQGAFDALYVGDILETEHVQENGESITVDADTDMVMGTPYNYELGYCRGGVFLGTTVKQAVKQDTLSSYKAPSLTVAKGGSLQIDGPTYAAPGTTITVQGTMNVSPNAFLCSETITSVIPEAYRQGIHLIIDGGTVTVNSGSMLDVGFGSVEIKNGGTLYNSGVVIQATDSQTGEVRNTTLQGGTIENSESGWVVLGAEVKNGARLTMVRGVNYKTTLAQLATYISDVRDVALGKYLQQEAASELKKYAALRLDSTNSVNLLMNSGNMLVVGAIKGNTIDLDKVRSGGSIYRGWDIVRDSTISVRGADFTNHAGQSDSDLQEYYALTDIDYENASYIGDDEADTIVSQKNMMALRVGTGSQGTSGISNFRITYVDTFGAERTQVVDTASLQNTYELVTDFQFCGTSQKEKGDSHLKTHKTGGAMSESNMPTTLEPVSNVTYIFQTASPVSYVKTISFQGTGVGSWTCTELNIYRLKYLFPLEEYGWSSEDWYVPFEGELIAETALGVDASGVRSTTFVWDSNLVVIGVPPESQSNTPSQQLNIYNAPDGVESQIDKTGFACFKASKEYKYYSTTMENYTFSTVLADTMSAGMESLYNVGTNVTFNKILSDADWQKKYEQDVTLDMQLIRSFQLQEDGYSVWLEFAIETDSNYFNSKQFVGQVVADITYRDTSGALQTKENVGVVGKIADYAERKSELADATEKNTEVSLPSFMFRRGYTNRFLQDFHDISSLVSIKFKLSSTEPASGLTIRSVSARQVYDRGTLTMNVFNEYQHIYSVEPQDLAATSNAKPLSIAATGTKNTGTLYFTSGNTITINLAEGEEEVEVETGESEGANDRISMTVELADTAGIAAGTAMTARVVYKDIYGDRCSVDANLLFDAESQKFMIPMNDLPKTADIGVPYQVEITGGTMAGKMLTAVKVNQLRDSGVEETFLFVPEAPMALLQAEPVTLVLSESEQDTYAARKGYTHENQEVYMKLGTLTETSLCNPLF